MPHWVPLPGRTHGHAGVAIRRDDGSWALNAGDAYFYHQEMDAKDPYCTPGLRFYQTMVEKDRRARFANQRRLRALHSHKSDEVQLFCSHDPLEFARLTGHPMGVSAPVRPARAAQASPSPYSAHPHPETAAGIA